MSLQSEWPSTKKSKNNKRWRECGEKGTLQRGWWECKLVLPTMENRMEVPQKKKTKNRATIQSCNLTPRHISEENHNLKRYMHPNVHCSTIYNSQDMEASLCVHQQIN